MKHFQILSTGLIFLSLLSCDKKEDPDPTTSPAQGAITLNCDISSDILLTNHNKLGVDYIIDCPVTVSAGKFAIDTNVRIQITPQGSLTINGTAYISAIGKENNPITFEGTSNTAGSWAYIAVNSNDNRNKMDYCILKNGGSTVDDYVRVAGFGYSSKAMLYAYGRLSLTNSTITNSEGQGVWFAQESKALDIKNNTFENNKSFPIAIYAGNMDNCDFASCTFTSNQKNQIAIYSVTSNAEVAEAVTIKKAPVAYYVLSSINFLDKTEFNAGTNFIVSSAAAIRVEETGYLKIKGTATENVSIEGESKTAGFWTGIHVESANTNNEFTYLNISDGGNEAVFITEIKANIAVGNPIEPGYLKLSNVSSTNFTGCALAIAGTDVTLVNNSTLTIPDACDYSKD